MQTMNFMLRLFIATHMIFTLQASQLVAPQSEFQYIQPIAVEEAPVVQAAVIEAPVLAVPVIKTPPPKVVVEKSLDSDSDGVVDEKDQCPNTSKEFSVDANGCPLKTTLKVTFEPNKYDISSTLIKQVEEFALFLQQNPGYQVIIYGHTDSQGEEKANQELSQKRADTIKEALIGYGIKEMRLTAIGKGETLPIAQNLTAEGREQNRRIEAQLIQ